MFLIRPAVRLRDGHHYIVAIRNLVGLDGEPIRPERPFQILRDGLRHAGAGDQRTPPAARTGLHRSRTGRYRALHAAARLGFRHRLAAPRSPAARCRCAIKDSPPTGRGPRRSPSSPSRKTWTTTSCAASAAISPCRSFMDSATPPARLQARRQRTAGAERHHHRAVPNKHPALDRRRRHRPPGAPNGLRSRSVRCGRRDQHRLPRGDVRPPRLRRRWHRLDRHVEPGRRSDRRHSRRAVRLPGRTRPTPAGGAQLHPARPPAHRRRRSGHRPGVPARRPAADRHAGALLTTATAWAGSKAASTWR